MSYEFMALPNFGRRLPLAGKPDTISSKMEDTNG